MAPTLTSSSAASPLEEMKGLRESLKEVGESYGALEQALTDVSKQGPKLQTIKENMPDPTMSIKALNQRLKEHDDREKVEVEALQELIKAEVRVGAFERARPEIRSKIRTEITDHVHLELASAFSFPSSTLEAQASQSRRLLRELEWAVRNVNARTSNVAIGSTRLDDPLSPLIRTPQPSLELGIPTQIENMGTASELFPPTLGALFDYEDEELQRLLTEYSLQSTLPAPASPSFDADRNARREANLNRFLRFIGVASFSVRCRDGHIFIHT